jgi:hypothetical protein
MSMYTILPDGKLAITATESSSKHDFDFLVGGWKIRNRKLKEPLAGCDEWDEFDATQIFARSYRALAISIFFLPNLTVSPLKVLPCGCSIRRRASGLFTGPTTTG